MSARFFIKPIGIPNFEKMLQYPSFSKRTRQRQLIESVRPGDYFVLYRKSIGFIGIQKVKAECVFDANPNDDKYDNEDFPHYIEVERILLTDDALKISEAKKWSGMSEKLRNALNLNLQGGLFEIEPADFDWFKQKLEQQ